MLKLRTDGYLAELNLQALSFTWRDKAFKSKSRQDFSLITADLVKLTKESNIID